jgi:hypothetical protein
MRKQLPPGFVVGSTDAAALLTAKLVLRTQREPERLPQVRPPALPANSGKALATIPGQHL